VILILLFPLVGSIVYFAVGRPMTTTPRRETWRPGNGFPEVARPTRSVAPDDDPAFLRNLEQQTRRDDAELLRRWEEDLKRRENDLRKREDTPPVDGWSATLLLSLAAMRSGRMLVVTHTRRDDWDDGNGRIAGPADPLERFAATLRQ
jgi:hypothetical protein